MSFVILWYTKGQTFLEKVLKKHVIISDINWIGHCDIGHCDNSCTPREKSISNSMTVYFPSTLVLYKIASHILGATSVGEVLMKMKEGIIGTKRGALCADTHCTVNNKPSLAGESQDLFHWTIIMGLQITAFLYCVCV